MRPDQKRLKSLQNEVHICFAFPDAIQDADLLAAYSQLLTEEERAQQQRFYFAKHRHQYLITRALVRTTLSQYTAVDPADWRFSQNEYGRPEIMTPADAPHLRFNLSHTDGLIMCGVVLRRDIGVDVESIDRKGVKVEIADRYFSPQEVADLHTFPEEEQNQRFFQYWTLKESYIKARGMGLFLPLEQFSFSLSDHAPLQLSFDLKLQDEPNRWQCWLLRPTPKHYAAISVCRATRIPYPLVIKQVVPFQGEQEMECQILNQTAIPSYLT